VFNIGGGELLVILLVVLIFIGPSKLPEVARTLGKVTSSIRQMNSSFQEDMKRSFDEPIEKMAREKGRTLSHTGDIEGNITTPENINSNEME
jgi:sec-independent protein translocase protein TatB